MYIYNNFTGYGTQEVIDNILQLFASDYKKKAQDRSTIKLWILLEGFIFWAVGDQLFYWYGCDDGERVGTTFHVIGIATLSILNLLEGERLLQNASPIKNIPLVLALYLLWSKDFEDAMDSASIEDAGHWPHQVIAYAVKHDIELACLHNMEQILDDVAEMEYAEEADLDKVHQKFRADKSDSRNW